MNDWATIFFHVDDVVVLCQSKNLSRYQQLRDQLHDRYEFRDLGVLKWFLGIRIIRNREEKKLWLCQDSYVEKIISAFHLQDVKPALTPMGGEELVPCEEKAIPPRDLLQSKKSGIFSLCSNHHPGGRRFYSCQVVWIPSKIRHLSIWQGAYNRAFTHLNGTKNA